MTDFLPEGYKAPQGNYMKFQDGENTFRVLSSAIVGWEYWNKDNKPVRSKKAFTELPKDIRWEVDKNTGKEKPTAIRHFWAFVVWNYNADKVQILEVTQVSVQDAIKAYVENKRWGDPKGYDITVSRSGTGFDTEYVTMANPHTPIEKKEIGHINLSALYEGADPFLSSVKYEEGEADAKDIPLLDENGRDVSADKF